MSTGAVPHFCHIQCVDLPCLAGTGLSAQGDGMVGGIKTAAPGKAEQCNESEGLLSRASKLIRGTLEQLRERIGTTSQAGLYTMKNFNGSQCTFHNDGSISELKDCHGRSWRFRYDAHHIIEFENPNGTTMKHRDGVWRTVKGVAPEHEILSVAVNRTAAEVTVTDKHRTTTYKQNGTTVVNVTKNIDGVDVEICFTEYATRPHRAFVVVEKRGDNRHVSLIQDANAKLFKIEYDNERLARYIDLSNKPTIIWTAEYAEDGAISAWQGVNKSTGRPMGNMYPVLSSVDLAGNRHFVGVGGSLFLVGPSGMATTERRMTVRDDIDAEPLLAFAGFAPAHSDQW